MKKSIKYSKYLGKKKDYIILILLITFVPADLGFSSGSGEQTVMPDTYPKIPAYCLTPYGATTLVSNAQPGYEDRNKGWQMYSLTEFHKDPITDIIKLKDGYIVPKGQRAKLVQESENANQGPDPSAEKIIEYCKTIHKGGEVAEQYMAQTLKQQFGKNDAVIAKNIDIIRQQKDKYKGNFFIPLSVINSNTRLPENFYDSGTNRYIIIKPDTNGGISNKDIQTISAIRMRGVPLAITEMVEKANAVLKSGNVPIDVETVQKQLEAIERLGVLYDQNIATSRTNVSQIFQYDYNQLNGNVENLYNYFSTAMLGNNQTLDPDMLKQMITLYDQTNSTLSRIKIITNSVRPIFDQMNAISKEMLGVEPSNLDVMLDTPGKYTIPVRFISDPLQNRNDKVKLFYECDNMISKMESIKSRYDTLKQIDTNFLPQLSSKIDALTREINAVANERKSFELLLATDTQPSTKNPNQGNGENQKEVKVFFEKLQLSIIELNRNYEEILQSFQSVADQKDPIFQTSLKEQRARLEQLAPAVQENEDYRNKMPGMVQAAYATVQSRKSGEISALQDAVNGNVQQMNTLLTPIIAEINAKKDATPLWNQSSGAIQDIVVRLNEDKDKIAAKFSTTTDKDVLVRNSLETLTASVISTLKQEETIKTRIAVSQMMTNYTQAQALIKKMQDNSRPPIPDSFQAALAQYNQDKNQTALISKYNELLAEEQKIKGVLEANAKTLATMDQNNPDVISLSNNIKALIQPSQATYLNKTFNNSVIGKWPFTPKPSPLPIT